MGENQKVFISYAHEDEEAAMKLYGDFKKANVSAWIDKECLLPGQNWKIAIRQAIKQCRYFIAILSTKSVGKKGFVQRELSEALEILSEFPESDVFIIPVRLDECQPSHEKLNDLHWADMFPKWENGLEKIFDSIGYPRTQITTENSPIGNMQKGWNEMEYHDRKGFGASTKKIFDCSCNKVLPSAEFPEEPKHLGTSGLQKSEDAKIAVPMAVVPGQVIKSTPKTMTIPTAIAPSQIIESGVININGWEGCYTSDGEGYLERSCNDFKLRIFKFNNSEQKFQADVNAKGCCERIWFSSSGKYIRFYDYSRIGSGSNVGYTSMHNAKEIGEDLETVEDLAEYLVKYAQGLNIDKWMEDYKKQNRIGRLFQ